MCWCLFKRAQFENQSICNFVICHDTVKCEEYTLEWGTVDITQFIKDIQFVIWLQNKQNNELDVPVELGDAHRFVCDRILFLEMHDLL